jgi:SAM-dependent methyltransferase
MLLYKKQEVCMDKKTEETLAKSLTAEVTGLLEYIPYLLQDLWELGSNPEDIEKLIRRNIKNYKGFKVLDLACGKGAVSVKLSKNLGIFVKGIDIIKEFTEYAKQKSVEYGTSDLCEFVVGDINKAVDIETDYDIVIFGAVGNVLGNPEKTLSKLKQTIKNNGFIIIDEAYLLNSMKDIKYKNYEYITRDKWLEIFEKSGLKLVDEIIAEDDELPDKNETDVDLIEKRAKELSDEFPEKKNMFAGYVRSQRNECEDLEENIEGVTWLLQKIQD